MATPMMASPTSARCLACNSLNRSIVFCEFKIPIVRCHSCGHVNSTFVNDQHYDQYFSHDITQSDIYWWDEGHRLMFEEFGSKFLQGKSGNLLDVGAGLGYFVRFALGYPGWNVLGYEISAPAVDYAITNLGLKGRMAVGAVEESGFAAEYFDLITLWDVLEHIPNPDLLLAYFYRILKPDGILFIATPHATVQVAKASVKARLVGMREGTHYLEAKDHVNLYTPKSLRLVLSRSNFKSLTFTHLRPIQSVSGSRSRLLRSAKNSWYLLAKLTGALTQQTVNLNNNLFAVATKG